MPIKQICYKQVFLQFLVCYIQTSLNDSVDSKIYILLNIPTSKSEALPVLLCSEMISQSEIWADFGA